MHAFPLMHSDKPYYTSIVHICPSVAAIKPIRIQPPSYSRVFQTEGVRVSTSHTPTSSSPSIASSAGICLNFKTITVV